MNVGSLFRGDAGEKQPDISQVDLMKVLGHGQRDGDNLAGFDRRYSTHT
jgi:hypothetical protein